MAPKAPPKPTASSSDLGATLNNLWTAYNDNTSARLKSVDAFLAFLVLSGVAQFLYCVLVTNFPFNAFLAGCADKLYITAIAAETLPPQVWEHRRTVRAYRQLAIPG